MSAPVLELTGVTKNYGALRPLRVEHLVVSPGNQVALMGLDQPSSEVLINLLTGASLPDTGEVRIFGRSTSEIHDSTDWLATLDRFGIVSERAALLEPMTVIQNLALPFSLEIEPPPSDVVGKAVALGAEAGLTDSMWEQRVGDLDPLSRMRVRLGRALAFEPQVLLLEHPSVSLAREHVVQFGVDVRMLAERRKIATLAITADPEFAGAVSAVALLLQPASGRLQRR